MTGVLDELLLTRRPVLDAHIAVDGYEIVHRAPGEGARSAARVAAATVVDSLLAVGREELTGGADLWLTVPEALLRSHALVAVPGEGIVLGVPAGVRADAALHQALVAHREAGYATFLDRAVPDDPRFRLLEQVDHVRITAPADAAGTHLISELAGAGTTVVVAGVRTRDRFEQVHALGATRFQGPFWTEAHPVHALRPLRFAPGHLQLLSALSQQEVDLREVEELIRRDITLTDRFLRLIRRVVGYRKVASIHDGLVLLGVRAVQRWVSLLTLGRLADTAPAELVTLASGRARSCELLEEMRGGDRRLEAFTLGMFSVLGPGGYLSAEILDVLPVSGDVRSALESGGGPLRPLLDVELATEDAEWHLAEEAGRALGVGPSQLADANRAALRWSAAVCA